jgi:polysaccharide biosynthesis/export protein
MRGERLGQDMNLSKVMFVLSLLVASIIAGCANTPVAPPAPAVLTLTEYKYLIGPGDILSVIVWQNPDLSTSVPVRPDGRITISLVEDLVAAGKDPTMVAREIERAMSRYIRDPVVNVVVTSFSGPYGEQVRVVGQAAKPQALAYRSRMTLLDVLIAVGGITPFADGNRSNILRTSEGNKLYSVRIDDLLRKGDISANVMVQPGDVLVIPEAWF